jgi:hypothetical protein
MSDLIGNDRAVTLKDGDAVRQSIEQLRDQVRVRIHLGSMDLRDAFEKLEHEADRLVAQLPPAATRALNDLAVRLRRLAHALDGKH